MQYRSSKEIRSLFVDFWVSKGCHHYKSFSLVPDDPTLLFTIAGMVPFKKYYLGLEEPEFSGAVTSQKCIRTNDIENVGNTARHHTFFEMLGNFSWGSYFKRESLLWGWEFLTEVIGLDGNRMYATIYKDDEEAFQIWTDEIGLPPQRVIRCGEEENFWFMGPQGPCGPDSEVLYDQGEAFSCGPDCHPGCDCDRYLEIWNHVFTQYDRQSDGSFLNLPRKNIDTGMGLERLTSLVQGVTNDFETDLFLPLMEAAGKRVGVHYGDGSQSDLALKVIADHVRAVSFMIADGILPANDGRGYVLRRLLRRASRYGRLIGISQPFLTDLVPTVIQAMGDPYRELIENRLTIEQVIALEENRFGRTINQGIELLQQEIADLQRSKTSVLDGSLAFQLYDTYGFPLELTKEICAEQGIAVDEERFKLEMEQQRERARASSKQLGALITGDVHRELLNHHGPTPFLGYDMDSCAAEVVALIADGREVPELSQGQEGEVLLSQSPFYGERGGQVGDTGLLSADGVTVLVQDTVHPVGDLIVSKVTVTKGTLSVGQTVQASVDHQRRKAVARNHTATHLLHQTLCHLLGGHVRQNGSLVSEQFLRFDYTHFKALDREQIEEVEVMVNAAVMANLPVTTQLTDIETAKASGAKALFEEKYGNQVRVVSVGDFSSELCGGVHVASSGEIGLVKIVGEESIGSGIRRITAVTGGNAVRTFQTMAATLGDLSQKLSVQPLRFVERIEAMEQENRELKKRLDDMTRSKLSGQLDHMLKKEPIAKGVTLFSGRVDGQSPELLREACDRIKDADPGAALLLISKTDDDKVQILCMLGQEAQKAGLHAGSIVKALASIVGGSGGGRPNMAQAGGKDPTKIDQALAAAPGILSELMGA